MKTTAFFLLLLTSCGQPQVYTKPAIGMSGDTFKKVCPPTDDAPQDDFHTFTTANGEVITITRGQTSKRPESCIGVFTFVNGKLDSISH